MLCEFATKATPLFLRELDTGTQNFLAHLIKYLRYDEMESFSPVVDFW